MRHDLFLNLLNSNKRQIALSDVIAAFFDSHKEHQDDANYREPLNELLIHLEQLGKIEFPKANYLWDSVGYPELPKWIKVVREKRAQSSSERVVWLPELGKIAVQLKQKKQLQDLALINTYLINHRQKLTLVPFRERSLKIFGDEHYLDSKIKSGCLFGGRLPLESIYAFEAREPMPYERPPSLVVGRPILIVENHHSFSSFVAANSIQNVFSAVCYSSGNTLASREYSIDSIGNILKTKRFLYLGDVDPQGVSIPLKVNCSRRNRGVPELFPAIGFYYWLLSHAEKYPIKKNQLVVDETVVRNWFGLDDNISKSVIELFSNQMRIPQESLGLEELLQIDMKKLIG